MRAKRLFSMALTASLAGVLIFATPASALIKQGDTGAVVTQIQQRLIDLDYYSFKPTGSFGGMTRQGIIYFQEGHGVLADGSVGDETLNLLFGNDARRNSIPAKVKIPIGPGPAGTPEAFGVPSQWKTEMSALFEVGVPCAVTDLNTGKSFSVTRVGGVNHAMVRPASTGDNDVILEIFGGSYNWSKRPVMINVKGARYAASLQGMPYGDYSDPPSSMKGALSMYFHGSTSDSANLPDEEHRRTLLKATGVQWK